MSIPQTLSNLFLATTSTLNVFPQANYTGLGMKLAPGLEWTFTPTTQPSQNKTYQICTFPPITINSTSQDTPQQQCLDIYVPPSTQSPEDNNNATRRTRVRLNNPDIDSPGQKWTLHPVNWTLTPQVGKFYKLSNEWTGDGWYLDTANGNFAAFMSTGANFSGQYWNISVV